MASASSEERSRYLAPISIEYAGQARAGRSVVLTGELLQLAVVYLNPGAEIPWHSHPNETMVTLIAGSYELWIGDEHFQLQPGWAAWIPADMPHRALVGDHVAIEVEAFAPPRDDYAQRTPQFDYRRTRG
jgi:quercetin dioxygenase-like cupin family protein